MVPAPGTRPAATMTAIVPMPTVTPQRTRDQRNTSIPGGRAAPVRSWRSFASQYPAPTMRWTATKAKPTTFGHVAGILRRTKAATPRSATLVSSSTASVRSRACTRPGDQRAGGRDGSATAGRLENPQGVEGHHLARTGAAPVDHLGWSTGAFRAAPPVAAGLPPAIRLAALLQDVEGVGAAWIAGVPKPGQDDQPLQDVVVPVRRIAQRQPAPVDHIVACGRTEDAVGQEQLGRTLERRPSPVRSRGSPVLV